jgi:hypothetical protein
MTGSCVKFFTSALAGIVFISWSTLTTAAPETAVDQPVFNFGSIPPGKKMEHVFTIRNVGDKPLAIKSVRPSCGCTAVSKTASVIQPGKSGDINSSFDSTNFEGAILKTITVDTNDPKAPTSTLTIKGTVIEEIQISPKQVSLGRVKENGTAKAAIILTNKGNKPLKIASVTSTLAKPEIEADKMLLNPGESTKISVTVRPARGDRLLNGILVIHTDNRVKSEIQVPIYGTQVFR